MFHFHMIAPIYCNTFQYFPELEQLHGSHGSLPCKSREGWGGALLIVPTPPLNLFLLSTSPCATTQGEEPCTEHRDKSVCLRIAYSSSLVMAGIDS